MPFKALQHPETVRKAAVSPESERHLCISCLALVPSGMLRGHCREDYMDWKADAYTLNPIPLKEDDQASF